MTGLEAFDVEDILQNFVVFTIIAVPELAHVRLVANAELYQADELFLRARRGTLLTNDILVDGLGQLKFETKRVELFVRGLIVTRVRRRVEDGRGGRVRGRAERARYGVVIAGHEIGRVVLVRLPVVEGASHEHVFVKAHVFDFDGTVNLKPVEEHVLERDALVLDLVAKGDIVGSGLIKVERVDGYRARHLTYVVSVVGGADAVVVVERKAVA